MKKILVIVLLGVTTPVVADNIVIADFGGESAIRFYEPLQPEHDDSAPYYPNSLPSSVSEMDMLPVISHKLSLGKVESKRMNLSGIQPIFLIGSDNSSIQWLLTHRQKLIELNATGLVVNVESAKELMRLREAAPELQLLPISGDDLAERIPLSHYPALITETGISQ